MVLKVLFLYIPLPMFWALFDQQVKQKWFGFAVIAVPCRYAVWSHGT